MMATRQWAAEEFARAKSYTRIAAGYDAADDRESATWWRGAALRVLASALRWRSL